jgi:hypothetical protein
MPKLLLAFDSRLFVIELSADSAQNDAVEIERIHGIYW